VLWLVGVVLFAGAGAAQMPAVDDMSSNGANVFAFEFAATTDKADEILAEWGDQGRDAARTQLLLDYPYLVGYGLLLWLLCTAAGAPRLALVGAAAAGFDALENVALLLIRSGHTAQPWPAFGAGFATVKFAASTAALVGGLVLLVRRRRRDARA
jgi:hypothetical protein